MKAPVLPPVGRLAVSIPEAAAMCGFSENHFRARVLPSLPVIPGTRPRIVVKDLEAWLDEHKISRSASTTAPEVHAVARTSARRNARRPHAELSAAAKRLQEKAAKHAAKRLAKGR